MLKRLWQWLKRWIQRLFKTPARESDGKNDDEVEVWLNQGNQQFEVGNFAGAIASYDKVIAIQPDYYLAWSNRGIALSDLGRNEEAILKSYRVVSLAACETAITGNHTIISEHLGLASGFMACGVAHVISTLWEVESAASALVMIQFYRKWQQGKPEAVALAEATQWLRNVIKARF